MHSPAVYPDSTIDQDDVVYPCKGCGEILEEGKAFELAGNRWHIDCFRCNTCGTLLDSDANLLLLGDGSLICNNCTYSCSACNNKIEDLAILTGDQAFCASCFRCRNCKNKIENLRYARTTQGIFCMSCYESLTQKRRKNRNKQKQNAANTQKALPEPPRHENSQNSFPSDTVDTPSTEKHSDADSSIKYSSSVRTLTNNSVKESTREMSSSTLTEGKDNLTLPASTYQASSTNPSTMNSMSASIYDPVNDLADGLFVPLVLDPNPAAGTSPMASAHEFPESVKGQENKSGDYLGTSSTSQTRPSREFLQEGLQHGSRSSSTERKGTLSPHIAYQEKTRQQTDHLADLARKRGPSTTTSPRPGESQAASPYVAGSNDFRLQDAPRPKKPGSRNGSYDTKSPTTSSTETSSRNITPQLDVPNSASPPEIEDQKQQSGPDSYADRSPNGAAARTQRDGPHLSRPKRGDSLGASTIPRKEIPGSASGSLHHIAELGHERKISTGSARHNQEVNGGMTISKPIEASSSSAGTGTRGGSVTTPDAFVAPRHAPPPPLHHRPSGSNGTVPSDKDSISPTYMSGENGDSYEGVLRKMSNAMRGHARSVSDKVIPSPRSQKHPWPRSPMNGSVDLGTPATPESREEYVILRSQLRRAQQRIAELEAEKNNLQGIVNGSPEMSQVNTALKEKRSTMAILDTQREIIVRELEVMTDHLKQAKDGNKPLEIQSFKSEVMSDFAAAMKRLKDSLSSEIESLMQKRNDLNDEITTLIQMKDKGFSEYENLSNRNVQLTQHNNELIQNIQDMMKANKQPNGLGLYLGAGSGLVPPPSSAPKEKQIEIPLNNDLKQMMLDSSNASFVQDSEQDSAIITTPHVVKIKQQKPNMLRKGGFGKALKGIKGALAPDRPERTPTYPTEGTPYQHHVQDAGPGAPKSIGEPKKFTFFGSDRNGNKHLRTMQNNGSNPNLLDQPSSQLFGTDLPLRCAFENRDIPSIVIRCVQEVELRGMDVEGVYRKSGGSGQVNVVKAGFEKNDDYDISDPELEIHAVTSCLKQYFRRLPVPLITFDVYDSVLDAARIDDREKRAKSMREAIEKLPKAHRDCLEFLIFHLARVTSHERDNLMTPLNLAVVFAPTIMRPSTIEREMMDMQIQRQAVQSLLELNKAIFESAA